MLNIVGMDIELSRGNAAGITLSFTGEDAPGEGTKVLFIVRPAFNYDYNAIEKEADVENGAAEIGFAKEDTNDLKPGVYYWNACIQYTDGLEPWTVLRDWPEFRILPG